MVVPPEPVDGGPRKETQRACLCMLCMMNESEKQPHARNLLCLNPAWSARGKQGEHPMVTDGSKRPRSTCKACGKTCSVKAGTMSEGWRKPEWVITVVIALRSYGCPVQAIVKAFGRDERTGAHWIEHAGKHGEQVHTEVIVQHARDLHQVQADEISITCDNKVAWMAMAIMGPIRLWLGGVVSPTRDHRLTDRLVRLVRACCLPLASLLVCCDGLAASPGSLSRAFRENVSNPSGIGRTRLEAGPEILSGIINTHRQEQRVVHVTREMLHGVLERA